VEAPDTGAGALAGTGRAHAALGWALAAAGPHASGRGGGGSSNSSTSSETGSAATTDWARMGGQMYDRLR